MKKTKGILNKLPTEQSAALERWLFEDQPALTYAQAQERLQREFAVEVSLGPLHQFYQRRGKERMLERMIAKGKAGDATWGELGKQPAQAFEALMEVVGRAAFDIPANGGEALTLAELKDLAAVAALGLKANAEATYLRIKAQDVDYKGREVALKETKYRDAVAKETLEPEEGGLSDETIEKIRDAVGLM